MTRAPESIRGESDKNVTVYLLRLSMMHPDGKVIPFEEHFDNRGDIASFDAARVKLTAKARERVADGWDVVGRFVVQVSEQGGEQVHRGKPWEWDGPEPTATPKPKEAVNGEPSSAAVSAATVEPLLPPTPHSAVVRPVVAEPTEAFLLELGDLCMRHRLILAGEGLRIAPLSMKGLKAILDLGG